MHPRYPFRQAPHNWPITASQVNALFGFTKVPALFHGVTELNGRIIFCKVSQPNRKHRMFTYCPVCEKEVTVGCLNQHMNSH